MNGATVIYKRGGERERNKANGSLPQFEDTKMVVDFPLR